MSIGPTLVRLESVETVRLRPFVREWRLFAEDRLLWELVRQRLSCAGLGPPAGSGVGRVKCAVTIDL